MLIGRLEHAHRERALRVLFELPRSPLQPGGVRKRPWTVVRSAMPRPLKLTVTTRGTCSAPLPPAAENGGCCGSGVENAPPCGVAGCGWPLCSFFLTRGRKGGRADPPNSSCSAVSETSSVLRNAQCCCAAAGMLLLPHSTHLHLSRVPACSVDARSTTFDMLPLTAQGARATVMTGGQCCRHVGAATAATAACTAHVLDLRTARWTSLFGCGCC